jgi:hypothetical protein
VAVTADAAEAVVETPMVAPASAASEAPSAPEVTAAAEAAAVEPAED